MTARTKTTVEIWDRCECGRGLRSLVEATRGVCASCYWQQAPADTKQALSKLVSFAFKPTTEAEKDSAVKDAMEKLRRDEAESHYTPIP